MVDLLSEEDLVEIEKFKFKQTKNKPPLPTIIDQIKSRMDVD